METSATAASSRRWRCKVIVIGRTGETARTPWAGAGGRLGRL